MTCYRSRDNWHSYVKTSLTEIELSEMTSHLVNCPECRGIVANIQETARSLAKRRVDFAPPSEIKSNIMMSIDKNRYTNNFASVNSSYLFELKNWGLSMIAAGILLLTLNLTSLTPDFKTGQMTELNTQLNQQMTLPFDKVSRLANDALGKIESLTLSNYKRGEHP